MKPTNFKDQNCESKSSNCVIWPGPDLVIGEITICKGESVSWVIYNLALKITEYENIFNIDNYPVQCLSTVGPVTDFKSLINALITKTCE